MKEKRKRILAVLIVLTLVFIWGNSMLTGVTSKAFSEFVRRIIQFFLTTSGKYRIGRGLVRKLAHGTEYALLGMEVIALFRMVIPNPVSHSFLMGLAVAVIDETIQLFSDGRSGQIMDVWIDMGGFTVGLLILLLICTRRSGAPIII